MMSRTRAATLGLLAPAALALGMSADTSYRYLGTTLMITNEWERMLLCGVAEAAIIALTVYAWATRTKGPAYIAYAAVLVQALPAFSVSGGDGGPIRVILGPVLLAVMLHLLLGLELRMEGARSDGIVSAALREMRERLTASLGIGRRGADSAAIARSRAADRAVNLADTVASARPGTRRHSRRAAHLADAIDGARHGLEGPEADAAEAAIVSRVVRRKSVAGLATIATRHDWTAALSAYRDNDRDKGDNDRDTATTPVAVDRDNDRDTSSDKGDTLTEVPPPAPVVTRDTAPEPVALPAPVAPVAVAVPVSVRQPATSRRQIADQPGTPVLVASDGGSVAHSPAPAGASDTAPSVAQIVREAMTAGVTDRNVLMSRVQQYRPGTPRATVSRAVQREETRRRDTDRDTATTGQGAYL